MTGSISVLTALGQHSSHVQHVSVLSFEDVVNLFNADLVSYWPFANASGVDEQAQENAVVTGAPELGVPTIVEFDTLATGAAADGTCIAWPGTIGDYAQAAHDVAHKTASGTIVVFFQRDSATGKSQLIMADANAAAGGMAIGVNANGAPDAYIRDFGGTPVPLAGGDGDVQLDRAYCLIFKWGAGGGMSLALWDDNNLAVRRATSASSIGLSGTSAIRFGVSHIDTNQHDGPYARVLWMNRRITDVEEALLGTLAHTIARSAGSYRTLELGLNPLALWGLGEPTGNVIQDVIAGRNGTYTGVINYGALDLPANSADGAINFAGTGYGVVPHNAVFASASFSLSFWFRLNSIPEVTGGPAMPLITKNGATQVAGDLVVYVPSVSDFLRVRFRASPTVAVDIDDSESLVLGQKYHVCIRADNTGFDVFVNSRFIRKDTTYLNALTGNAAPWGVAFSPTFGITGDCELDEILFVPYTLNVPQISDLAQVAVSIPVAEDDTFAVPENVTTAVQVLTGDSFTGQPTIQIVNSDGGRAVAAGNVVNYAAPAVAADTVRSFTYRIVDSVGTSNTATATVTVLNAGVVPNNANFYPATGLTNTVISPATMSELQATVNAAAAGAHILIPPGTYAGGTLSFTNSNATAANPIVIRTSGARGSVTINDARWTLTGATRRIVIKDLYFVDPQITIGGTNNRMTRCRIDEIDRRAIMVVNAVDLRIDHMEVLNYGPLHSTTEVIQKAFIYMSNNTVGQGTLRNLLVDYCYCHDSRPAQGTNAQQLIGLAASSGGANGARPGFIIDHCLFSNINLPGEGELLGAKCSGIIYRFSTMVNCGGACYINAPRQGEAFEVRSNWFENSHNPPILVRGNDPLVIGNRCIGAMHLDICSGTYYGFTEVGYAAARDGRVIGNRMGTGFIRVGSGANTSTPVVVALRNNVTMTGSGANTRDGGGNPYQLMVGNMVDPVRNGVALQSGTTFAADSAAFVPAVKLNPADVGMGAPDPLCPTGPQS